MLGRYLVAGIAAVVVWKYRDSIGDYLKGNVGPAREKVDELFGTAQHASEALLDRAKEQVSSRIASARDKVRAGAWVADQGRATE